MSVPTLTAYCYPANYGSLECSVWDADHPSPHDCSLASPPSWCAQRWCYVDRDACKRSGHDVQGTALFPKLEGQLFFSYGSCATEDVGSFRLDGRGLRQSGPEGVRAREPAAERLHQVGPVVLPAGCHGHGRRLAERRQHQHVSVLPGSTFSAAGSNFWSGFSTFFSSGAQPQRKL